MKKLVYIFLIVVLILIVLGYTLYNKPHRQVQEERGTSIKASQLFEAFENDEQQANLKFLDKVLEVHGVVAALDTNQDGNQVVTLQTDDPIFGVSCTMEQPDEDVSIGKVVAIKGFCKGYLSDVVLTGCIVTAINNNGNGAQ